MFILSVAIMARGRAQHSVLPALRLDRLRRRDSSPRFNILPRFSISQPLVVCGNLGDPVYKVPAACITDSDYYNEPVSLAWPRRWERKRRTH